MKSPLVQREFLTADKNLLRADLHACASTLLHRQFPPLIDISGSKVKLTFTQRVHWLVPILN